MLVCILLLQWNAGAAEKDGGCIAYPDAPGAPGPVLFSHMSHGFSCDKCHLDAPMRELKATMDAVNQGKSCGSCHDGKSRGSRAPGAAPPVQDCAACHMPSADIVIRLNRMDPVAFSHVRHLGLESGRKDSKPVCFSCNHCHPEPFERASKASYGMEVPHESGACAKCHNGKRRKDGLPSAFAANTRCLTCHKPPAAPAKAMQQ